MDILGGERLLGHLVGAIGNWLQELEASWLKAPGIVPPVSVQEPTQTGHRGCG